MWMRPRQWTWYSIEAVGLVASLDIFHRVLTIILGLVFRTGICSPKLVKGKVRGRVIDYSLNEHGYYA